MVYVAIKQSKFYSVKWMTMISRPGFPGRVFYVITFNTCYIDN